jgi:hypothetical protein
MSKTCFLEYFIKREFTLPRMGKEIDFIVSTPRAMAKLGCGRRTAFIRAHPVAVIPNGSRPLFLVKRKDTNKHEDWLEDYELEPNPPLDLLCLLNRWREGRRPYRTTRRGPDWRLQDVLPGEYTGRPLP